MTNKEQCIKWYIQGQKKYRIHFIEDSDRLFVMPSNLNIPSYDINPYEWIWNPDYKFFESMEYEGDIIFNKDGTGRPATKEEHILKAKRQCAGKTAEEIFEYIVKNCGGEKI